jgi:GT2 family glycosyltransferase
MAGAPHPDPDVSIIVVTYRSAAYIGECAEAVRKASADVSAELIIVDNASGDGTADTARAAAPDAQVVENDRNGGFAYGCHAGVARARGRLLLFVNPDAVPAPGSVAALLACARRNPPAGIVGGRSVLEDGTPDPRSWWGRPTFWSTLCFALLLGSAFPGSRVFDPEAPGPWTDEERQVPIVTGGFMLVDRALWDELGGFDQSIFMYGEDADLCLRARKAGFRPMVTARAEYRHEVGASSSSVRKLVLLFTGKATVLRRHLPYGRRGAGVRLLTLGVLLRALLGRLVSARPQRQGRPTATGADWRGLWAARREWTAGWPVSQSRS